MTPEIIEMAEGCGFTRTHTGEVELWLCNKNDLERLAKLVDDKATEREREACAKEADKWSKRDDDVGAFIGKAIRARGES